MFRDPHGEDAVDGTGVAGEIADSCQTTVPGPAARPMAKASRRFAPCPTRPETSPFVTSARRPSRAWSPEITWPAAGPLPADAVTRRPVPVWVVTSHAWPLPVV